MVWFCTSVSVNASEIESSVHYVFLSDTTYDLINSFRDNTVSP